VEKVILVDEYDREIGQMEKMEAHEKALLHRAFSIFVFNNEGKLLLQRRATHKYHSAGLWTNTCCSHQRHGETTLDASHRRLQEEMGFDCDLEEKFSFIYKVNFDNGLSEHEYDHVVFGTFNDEPQINPDEVSDFRYVSIADIKEAIELDKSQFTFWFLVAFEELDKKGLI
jgi:isopentenyl-diphosphate delta-isomerase